MGVRIVLFGRPLFFVGGDKCVDVSFSLVPNFLFRLLANR